MKTLCRMSRLRSSSPASGDLVPVRFSEVKERASPATKCIRILSGAASASLVKLPHLAASRALGQQRQAAAHEQSAPAPLNGPPISLLTGYQHFCYFTTYQSLSAPYAVHWHCHRRDHGLPATGRLSGHCREGCRRASLALGEQSMALARTKEQTWP